jgi:hypothetical protein
MSNPERRMEMTNGIEMVTPPHAARATGAAKERFWQVLHAWMTGASILGDFTGSQSHKVLHNLLIPENDFNRHAWARVGEDMHKPWRIGETSIGT